MRRLTQHQNIGNGKQEVARLKMIIEDTLSDSPQFVITPEELNSYFLPFAERALTT
jgi:hypothetical protein